jgi:hypothetical protein
MSTSARWGVKCEARYCRWRGARVASANTDPTTAPCPRCGGPVELTMAGVFRALDQIKASRKAPT